MRLLLDSHAFYWWVGDDSRLGANAREAIRDPMNAVMVSAATAWELAIKVRKGIFAEAAPLVADFEAIVAAEGFLQLDMLTAHALRAGGLDRHHDDPFDRMLIAQALLEGVPIASGDESFDPYGVSRIW